MAEVQDATNVGKPVPIVLAEEDHHFVLDEEALESILLKDDIKDRNVVVVFVAGSYPKGKSISMDFVLRYMKATYHLNLINEDAHWIGSDDKPLDGFSWLGGSDRDTTGILMWSEVFKATLDDGKKVAIVLLVDTQGTFNSESTVKDCATVFALSTLLSSIKIYNLKVNIQEDNLHHLQLRYDAEDGKKILDKILQISDKQHPEHLTLRKHITSCFSDIVCYLMPHPGLNVATNPNVDGKLFDIEPDLKKKLITLIPMLLSPNRLILKEIGGQKIKAKEYSGVHSELGSTIDDAANIMWDNGLQKGLEQAIKQAINIVVITYYCLPLLTVIIYYFFLNISKMLYTYTYLLVCSIHYDVFNYL